MTISLLPDNPAAWTYRSWEDLMAIPREEREALQLEAVRINFARMRNRIPALKKLADRQGVETSRDLAFTVRSRPRSSPSRTAGQRNSASKA